MKKIILSISLGLLVSGVWAQRIDGPKIVTPAQSVQQNNYTIQVGVPFLGESINSPSRNTTPYDVRFPWDILYLYDTFSDDSFDVSKGYFGDKILISWTIRSNVDDIKNIKISRREYNVSGTNNWVEIANRSGNVTEYEDKYVEGGVLYEYKLDAEFNNISPVSGLYSTFITGLGYRSPTAIITGNVNFEGGNPVKDVTIKANSNGSDVNSGKGLQIPTNGQVEIVGINKPIKSEGTLEAWMKPLNAFNDDAQPSIRLFEIESGPNSIEVTVNLRATSNILEVNIGGSVYQLQNYYPSGRLNSRGDDILVPISEFNNNFIHYSMVLMDGQVPQLFINGRAISTAYKTQANQNLVDIDPNYTAPYFDVSIPTQTTTLNIGGLETNWNNVYLGGGNALYLDEIRIWNTAKDVLKIRTDYRRYIGGNETTLVAYLRANEGTGKFAYDLSRNGFDYNKNHGKLWDLNTPIADKVLWVSGDGEIPSSEQLGILGVTDSNGNYEITAIPYSGTGESFTITPLLGVHQFEPAQQVVFLGQGSEVVNKIDFLDKSSFTFKGRVLADTRGVFKSFPEVDASAIEGDTKISGPGILDEGYNYYQKNGIKYNKGAYWLNDNDTPNDDSDDFLEKYALIATEGVNIYVDGDIVLDENNIPIVSDSQGNFEVSVPIGDHYISVKKQGYNFTHNGRFPAEVGTFYEFFEDAEEVVNFVDETRVTLVGRVVGGTTEAEKPIGFGQNGLFEKIITNAEGNDETITISSINNIGVATLTLDYTPPSSTVTPYTKFDFKTNSESGEYRVNVMPLNYSISQTNGLKIDTNAGINILSANETVNANEVIAVTTPEYEYDDGSLETGEPYHYEKSFTYRSTPIFEVVNQESEADIEIDAINYSTDGFDYPIYKQAVGDLPIYRIELKSYELYENFDGTETVSTEVPINDGDIIVNNNLARGDSNSEELQPQGNGIVYYNFKAGIPSISKPFTKNIDIKLRLNNIDYEALNLRKDGVIIGGADDGSTRFVTEAPNVPDLILRDPPGTNSFATIEAGQSFTFTSERDFTDSGGFGLGLETDLGAEYEAGVGIIIKTDATNSAEVGFSVETSSTNGKSLSKTYTFNQSISTSDDPEFVGAEGDLYIGKGTNISYGTFDMVKPFNEVFDAAATIDTLKLTNDYGQSVYISKEKGLAFNEQSTGTFFIYSQKFILETLLPDLETIVADAGTSEADVKKYTQQIQIWKKFIHDNERAKYRVLNESESVLKTQTGKDIDNFITAVKKEIDSSQIGVPAGIGPVGYASLQEKLDYANILKNVHKDNYKENISFDAGVGEFSKSYETQVVSETSIAYNIEFEETLAIELGLKVGGIGFIAKSNGFVKQDRNASIATEQMTNTIISYTLKDNDPGNFLSVDVVNLFDGNGPVFSTRGGRTSCPYEDAGRSIFYNNEKYVAYNNSIKPFNDAISSNNNRIEVLEKEIDSIETIIGLYRRNNPFSPEIEVEKSEIQTREIELKFIEADNESQQQGKVDAENNFINSINFNIETEQETLSSATQKGEDPKISVEVADISNVLEGRNAEFVLKLENLSDVNSDAADLNYFKLIVYNDSNPNNAILNIPPEGIQVYVPYGEPQYFTLTVGKSISDVYDYENIEVYLESNCNFVDINDSVFVSAHFVPSCTEVVIDTPLNNWVYNRDLAYNQDQTTNPLTVDLIGFNQSFNSFRKIDLEYRLSTSPTWTRLQTYYNTQTFYDEAAAANESDITLINNPTISYGFDIVGFGLQDGNYEIRARSTCTNGTEFISEVISGSVDLNAPQRFGTPLPIDGILGAGEDLRVSFNENIFYNSAVSKIEILGATNQLPINNNVSLYFEGANNTVTIDRPRIVTGDFSLEFWMNNATVANSATLFSQTNGINIGLVNGQMSATIGGINASGAIATDNLFHHYTITLNNATGSLSIYQDDSEIANTIGAPNAQFTNSNTLVIGGNSFIGNIHDLRLWSKHLSLSNAYANIYTKIIGNENGLLGYWPMDEGRGTTANDLAFFKHGIVNAAWDIKPKGNAYEFSSGHYLELDQVGFAQLTNTMDATISFWIKTATAQEATIFSNGRGDGTDPVQSNGLTNKWAINMSSAGTLSFESEGNSYELTAESIADNSWHHVALLFNRLGSLRTYVDAQQVSSNPMIDIGGFSGNQAWLGARGYKDLGGIETVDRVFNGKLDEFRLWNTLRDVEQIDRDRFNEVDNQSIGLLLYARMNAPEPSTGNGPRYFHTGSGEDNVPDNAVLKNGAVSYTNDTPAIKPARNLIKFQVSHVINEDDMIIEPVVSDWAVLEGQVLDITVHRMFDAANNRQQSPITWTAFIQRNEVSWFAEGFNEIVDLVNYKGDDKSFEITVVNGSGKSQPYAITNVPNWMQLSTSSGTLSPDSKKIITVSIDKELAPNIYNEILYLETDFGFNQKLPVNLRVLEQEPDWTVNPNDYAYSTNIVGRIRVDGIFSEDMYDRIGAFSNDEVRGVTNLVYDPNYQQYYLYLTIYSNNPTGETIEFRIWDASKGKILQSTIDGNISIPFLPNDILGNLVNPTLFENTSAVEQNLALNKGWTWISFNVDDVNFNDLNTLTNNLVLETNDRILSNAPTQLETYTDPFGWDGQISSQSGLSVNKMYKVNFNNAQSLKIKGTPVDIGNWEFPVTVDWNWLPFGLASNTLLNEAMASYQATPGDVIKSQNLFAIYDEFNGWIGSLNYLEEGKGYMLRSGAAQIFQYPQYFGKSSSIKGGKIPKEYQQEQIASDFTKYSNNMNAVVLLPDGYNELLVFDADKTLKGIAKTDNYNDKELSFITIYGDGQEELVFYVRNGSDLKATTKRFLFNKNDVLGTFAKPIDLRDKNNEITLYPNPFTDAFALEVAVDESQTAAVNIYSITGQLVYKKDFNLSKGLNTISVAPRISNGIYMMHLVTNKNTSINKIIKN